ncbi:MAG: hypothetical protein IJY69_01075 [Clostridia bacterium]|nr:hypothetical protein [Clostridia bacterium]
MKIIKAFITIVVILSVFYISCAAEEDPDKYIKEFESIVPTEYDRIWDDTSGSLIGPDALIGELVMVFKESVGRAGSLFLILLSGLAISAAASYIHPSLSDSVSVGIAVITVTACYGKITSILMEVCSSLSVMQGFLGGFIPIGTSLLSASGSVSAASAQAMGMNVTLSLIGWLAGPVFSLIASFGMGVAVISSLGDDSLSSFSAGVRRFFVWVIGVSGALIMGMMSLQSFVAGARDSARMRAAKYAAGSLIPVVGNTVSGALGTLVGGLSYAKSMIGAGGVTVLCAIVISPLVMLLLYRLAVSSLSSLASYLGIGRIGRIYGALSSSFDFFISVYTVAAILCIFEVALFAVSGVQMT